MDFFLPALKVEKPVAEETNARLSKTRESTWYRDYGFWDDKAGGDLGSKQHSWEKARQDEAYGSSVWGCELQIQRGLKAGLTMAMIKAGPLRLACCETHRAAVQCSGIFPLRHANRRWTCCTRAWMHCAKETPGASAALLQVSRRRMSVVLKASERDRTSSMMTSARGMVDALTRVCRLVRHVFLAKECFGEI